MIDRGPITQLADRPLSADDLPSSYTVESDPDSAPPDSTSEFRAAGDGLFDVATSFQKVRLRAASQIESWPDQFPAHVEHVNLFLDLHRSDPEAAHRLAQAVVAMPEVGTEFLGFHLLAELGRGALGRVFLARQGHLADRYVVLKVSPEIDGEAQTLAQLQHTNVVPLYSTHRAGSLQAVCMPYFGSTTLADIIRDVRGRESLPNSGRGLVSTLVDRRSTVGPPSPANRPAEEPALPEAPRADRAAPVLEMLRQLSYVQAVIWMGARLADGLGHAHEHGILHRDLKPANILLTDDGQPMLLDFNLAHDTKLGRYVAAQAGGTLPFMAPEQLRAYQAQTSGRNFNSDLYSLGVILYELLTGRHPFPAHCGPVNQVIERMIQDRLRPPPSVRHWNPAVSPAVESIVHHLLEPNRARRYQLARHLQEDLERQLWNRPLCYARERSLRERFSKWVRRHPRLTSTTTAAVIGAVLLTCLSGMLVLRSQRVAALEAKETLGQFRADKRNAEFLMTARINDLARIGRGESAARAALDEYQVLDDAAWWTAPAVQRLPAAEQDRLRGEIGELLLLTARATTLRARHLAGAERDYALRTALALNERAEACQGPDGPSRVLWEQRAELAGLLGDEEQAKACRVLATKAPLNSATDRYLAAVERASQGRLRDSLPLLHEATEAAPQDFRGWFLLGVCHFELGQFAEAIGCYNTCLALAPEFPLAHLNRALARVRQHDHRSALADFDEALRLNPNDTDVLYQRALSRYASTDYSGAIDDLSQALLHGAPRVNVLLLRAQIREKSGDTAGARRDRDEGMRLTPTDELGWVSRGFARMAGEPEAALRDFDEALRINPRSLSALQNKAHVLAGLGRPEEAAVALDLAVELYPDFVNARAGRGIMLARLGCREAALRDAAECQLRDQQSLTTYQVADIYSLTSLAHPDDRRQAFRLLAKALEQGCGFDLLESDKDLDPIRSLPEFRELVDAARKISARAEPEVAKK